MKKFNNIIIQALCFNANFYISKHDGRLWVQFTDNEERQMYLDRLAKTQLINYQTENHEGSLVSIWF